MTEIHRQYFAAGSDIVLTNTFGANALKYHDPDHDLAEVIRAAVENVKAAARLGVTDGREVYAALDMGPTGKLLKPMGDLDFEEAYEAFRAAAVAGEQAGADLIHIETMSDTYEVKAAVLAAKENTNLPVFATMIFDEKGKLLTGGDVPSVAALLEGLGVDALGINCGMGPEQMMPILEELLRYTSLPVIVKPNAGLPKQKNGEVYYDVEPEEFAGYMEEIVRKGASLIGGCCRHHAGPYPQDDGACEGFPCLCPQTDTGTGGGHHRFFLWQGGDPGGEAGDHRRADQSHRQETVLSRR